MSLVRAKKMTVHTRDGKEHVIGGKWPSIDKLLQIVDQKFETNLRDSGHIAIDKPRRRLRVWFDGASVTGEDCIIQ